MSTIVKLGKGSYFLPGIGAEVNINNGPVDTLEGGKLLQKGKLKIAPWGKNNLLPQELFKLVWGNHLKPQLITTSRDFLIGQRLGVYRRFLDGGKRRFEPVENARMEDWLEDVEAEKYIRRAGFNLELWANVFTSFYLNRAAQIESLSCFDCTDMRATAIDPRVGRIEDYVMHPDWSRFRENEATVLAAYDRKNPTRFRQFIYHGRDEVPGQPYYALPAYYGTKGWTEVSNEIPKFHKSGLKNGYNIKYHIQIPADYFAQYGTEDEQDAKEAELLLQMDKWLSGVENVNKAFVSKFATDEMGRPLPGWKIEAVDDKMNTEAYIELDKQANTAHASGHGIDPSLAGIDQNSKLGGSGSEKRISYQLHIALRTPNKRNILLEPFNTVAKKIMGWDRDLFIGFEDMDVTTLADSKTGMEPAVNQAQ